MMQPLTVIGGDGASANRLAEKFATLVARARTPHRPRHVTVWEDVATSLPAYHSMVSWLADALPDAAPQGKLTGTDFSLVRCIQTVTGTPGGVPPADAFSRALERLAESSVKLDPSVARIRKQFLESRQYTVESLALLRVYYDVLIRDAIWVPAPIRRSSSTALPHLTTDMALKASLVQGWGKEAGIRGKLWRSHDFATLAEQGIWVAFLNGYRSQADATKMENGICVPVKERVVFTAKGEWEQCDRRARAAARPSFIKAALDWGTLPDTVCLTRPRQLSQSGFMSTIPLRCASRAVEAGIYDNHGFTFHHHGLPDIIRKTMRALAWSVTDVNNHDQVMAPYHTREVARRFGALFGPFAEEYVNTLHHAPAFSHGDHYGEAGMYVRGNILAPHESDLEIGNPSGINTTSITAKAVGVFYELDAIGHYERAKGIPETERISRPDPTVIAEFLAGRLGVIVLNLGDNNFRMAMDPRYVDYVKDPSAWSPYADVERTSTFSGYLIVGDGTGEPQFVPNIETLVRNTIVPDRPVGHDMRGHPLLALRERRKIYAVHPDAERLFAVMDKGALRFLGATLQQLAERTAIPPEIARLGNLFDMPDAVAQFLRNPDVIEYKVDAREIPGDLLERYYLSIPAEDCKRIVLDFFGGN